MHLCKFIFFKRIKEILIDLFFKYLVDLFLLIKKVLQCSWLVIFSYIVLFLDPNNSRYFINLIYFIISHVRT